MKNKFVQFFVQKFVSSNQKNCEKFAKMLCKNLCKILCKNLCKNLCKTVCENLRQILCKNLCRNLCEIVCRIQCSANWLKRVERPHPCDFWSSRTPPNNQDSVARCVCGGTMQTAHILHPCHFEETHTCRQGRNKKKKQNKITKKYGNSSLQEVQDDI